MKRSNVVTMLFATVFFVIAVLWLVGALVPADSNFKFGILDALVYWFGGFSLVSLISTFILKKPQATLLLSYVFGVICFGVAITIGLTWYVSIVLMVVYLAFLFMISAFLLPRKKWDRGENQMPEYKDYRQRKAEKEAAEKTESEDNDNI